MRADVFFIYNIGRIVAKVGRCLKRLQTRYVNIYEYLHFKSCGENLNINLPVYIIGEENIKVGKDFFSQPGLRLECYKEFNGISYSPELIIGDRVSINFYCHIGCINKIEIGNNVMIGSHVLIEDHSHGKFGKYSMLYRDSPLESKGIIKIEDNVWIGDNVCVMPGVTIGNNSIVGANAVVTHDIPPFSMAVGVPAKVIKRIENNKN